MTIIYCLGGVCGSGKTHLRQADSVLSQIDWIDIADVYADNPGIHWRDALAEVERHLIEWLEDCDPYGIGSVGVEAFFRPGNLQRRVIAELASEYDDVEVQYIWCAAPREQCYDRVLQDYEDNPCRQQATRLKLINKARWEWFQPRPDEEWRPAPPRRNRSRRRNRNRNRDRNSSVATSGLAIVEYY